MKFRLRIHPDTTQLEQMSARFGVPTENNTLTIPPHLGEGWLRYLPLPYGIQVHHYRYTLQHEFEVGGDNPADSGMYMLNINLSHRILHKEVGAEQLQLSQAGGQGAILYAPGYDSNGRNEIGKAYEVVFFAFPQTTFAQLTPELNLDGWLNQGPFCAYTELGESLEKELRNALAPELHPHSFSQQGALMICVGKLLQLFSDRKHRPSSALKLPDIERQMQVKEILTRHLHGNLPAMEDIAREVHISKSKLKSDFKSLFGDSLYRYYLARKMELAGKMVVQGVGTVAEISYQLGYSNSAQFSAQFKKHFGVPPSQYPAG